MATGKTAPLFLSTRRVDGWSVMDVAGEIDLATGAQLRACLEEIISGHRRPAHVIVDLSNVAFCDASGLSVLVAAHQQAQRQGGQLHLVCPEGQVLRVLRITELTRLLPVHRTLSDALADGGPVHIPPRQQRRPRPGGAG
jgi:anti-sigma B factor antagonist